MKPRSLLFLIPAAMMAGCGGGSGTPMQPNHVANVAQNVLQFSVGTANLAGTIALNVVTTYRQPKNGQYPGRSGTLLNSPTLTVPGTLAAVGTAAPASYDPTSTVLTAPAGGEVGTKNITSTPQTPGSTTLTSFGQSGGVFGYGIEPFNATGPYSSTSPNGSGLPFQVAPFPVPLYANAAPASVPPFVPWGGPPAFDIVGNGTSAVGDSDFPTGTAGVPLGIDVFAGVAPAGGSYTLAISVPANTGAINTSATATMPAAPTVLGIATAPAPAFDGKGGATFALTMPSGATEALVEVIDTGNGKPNCNGASSSSPVYYTLKNGATTLGDNAGPTGTPSICTAAQNGGVAGGSAVGDSITIYTIGFDYPFIESEYPSSLGNPSPTITGSGATDDITVSAPGSATST